MRRLWGLGRACRAVPCLVEEARGGPDSLVQTFMVDADDVPGEPDLEFAERQGGLLGGIVGARFCGFEKVVPGRVWILPARVPSSRSIRDPSRGQRLRRYESAMPQCSQARVKALLWNSRALST